MIGLSMTAYREKTLKGFDEWLEQVEALGFDFVELVSEWPHYLTKETLPTFKEAFSAHKLKVTLHAPFSDLNLASFNERIREASLGIIRETLVLAAELDALVVTIHPGHCSPVSVRNRRKYLEIHRESLRRIARWGEEYGVRIGVENMPRFPILDAQTCERLAEVIGDVEIGITFDVGHLNTTTGNFSGFLERFGTRIIHLHLHDNSGKSDEHLAPGEGTVPWKTLVPRLPDTTWALEVGNLQSARKGLEFLKNLH
ncbi:sugar phosphate isomerase/epimerase [Thermococcus sp. MV11]|uniref:sugar phosphate isomerase/epimerase family protein n=1 Tax=Thermococcus sp. MV11 TaxID=1638267 RepID=UPI001F0E4C06|nr:sugar phosphate isomerase/epimerase family protein [Thermococcus sp. MV11]